MKRAAILPVGTCLISGWKVWQNSSTVCTQLASPAAIASKLSSECAVKSQLRIVGNCSTRKSLAIRPRSVGSSLPESAPTSSVLVLSVILPPVSVRILQLRLVPSTEPRSTYLRDWMVSITVAQVEGRPIPSSSILSTREPSWQRIGALVKVSCAEAVDNWQLIFSFKSARAA